MSIPIFPNTPIDTRGGEIRTGEIREPSPITPIGEKKGPDFADALTGALREASGAEKTADDAAQRFAAGDPKIGIHEVMIAAEKASISVRYAVTLKNKVLEAYRELMNTPV